MGKFNFYIDQKIKTWDRNHVMVAADSEEEAVGILKTGDRDGRVEITYSEHISEACEELTPDDNDGYSTREIYDTGGNMLWENGESTQTNA